MICKTEEFDTRSAKKVTDGKLIKSVRNRQILIIPHIISSVLLTSKWYSYCRSIREISRLSHTHNWHGCIIKHTVMQFSVWNIGCRMGFHTEGVSDFQLGTNTGCHLLNVCPARATLVKWCYCQVEIFGGKFSSKGVKYRNSHKGSWSLNINNLPT